MPAAPPLFDLMRVDIFDTGEDCAFHIARRLRTVDWGPPGTLNTVLVNMMIPGPVRPRAVCVCVCMPASLCVCMLARARANARIDACSHAYARMHACAQGKYKRLAMVAYFSPTEKTAAMLSSGDTSHPFTGLLATFLAAEPEVSISLVWAYVRVLKRARARTRTHVRTPTHTNANDTHTRIHTHPRS